METVNFSTTSYLRDWYSEYWQVFRGNQEAAGLQLLSCCGFLYMSCLRNGGTFWCIQKISTEVMLSTNLSDAALQRKYLSGLREAECCNEIQKVDCWEVLSNWQTPQCNLLGIGNKSAAAHRLLHDTNIVRPGDQPRKYVIPRWIFAPWLKHELKVFTNWWTMIKFLTVVSGGSISNIENLTLVKYWKV